MPPTLPPYVCNPMNGTVEVHAYSDADGCRMSVADVLNASFRIRHYGRGKYASDDIWKNECQRWDTLAKQSMAAAVRS